MIEREVSLFNRFCGIVGDDGGVTGRPGSHRKGPPSPHGRIGAVCPALTPQQISRGIKRGRLRLDDGILERRCSYCGEFYPLDTEFWYFQPSKSSGMHHACKACYLEYRGQWRKRRSQQLQGASENAYNAF